MFTKITLGLVAVALASQLTLAQSPTPIVVQAIVVPGTAATTAPVLNVSSATTNESALIKALLEMKAANAEILRKQTATLLQLEEMEKAAEQIKIYTKRG
jgi:hypothetical protein